MKKYVLVATRPCAIRAADAFAKRGFTAYRIDGSQSVYHREIVATTFKNDQSVGCVLVATVDAMQIPIDLGPVDAISVLEEHPSKTAVSVAIERARVYYKPNKEPS